MRPSKNSTPKETNPITLTKSFKVFFDRQVFYFILLGFSSGLPFLLIFSKLSTWLNEEGVSQALIAPVFSWVTVIYSIKFLFAPFVDRLNIPILSGKLGSRRSLILTAQFGLVIGLIGMAITNPGDTDWSLLPADVQGVSQLSIFVVLVVFSSVIQDLVIEAYRIEVAEARRQGALYIVYTLGSRLGLFISSAGALAIAKFSSWPIAYLVMAGCIGAGMLAVVLSSRTEHRKTISEEIVNCTINEMIWIREKAGKGPKWMQSFICNIFFMFACPLIEFFRREGKWSLFILLVVALYGINTLTKGVDLPFLIDIGYTKEQIVNNSKLNGFPLVMGVIISAVVIYKYGLLKPLFVGAILTLINSFLFCVLASQSVPSTVMLAIVTCIGGFGSAIAGTAIIAFISNLTNRMFTATQFILLSGVMVLPEKLFGNFSKYIVDTHGYFDFYLMTALVSVPAILLLFFLCRYRKDLNNTHNVLTTR